MIFPSGTRRMMKLQQNLNAVNTEQDGDAERSEIVNSGGQNSSGAFDWNKLKKNVNNPAPKGKVDQMALQNALDEEGDQKNMVPPAQVGGNGNSENSGNGPSSSGNNIRDFIFGKLEELGVPSRLIMSNPDSIFKGTKDLTNNTLKGFYILPSFTAQRKISPEEAESIAIEIGNKFGLDQNYGHMGNNYKVEFSTKDMTPNENFGTSLQEIAGGKAGKQNMNQPKAANTHIEMIKTARSQLFNNISGK